MISVFLLFALFGDEPEVFLPKYSQTSILYAAHSRGVVNKGKTTKYSKEDKANLLNYTQYTILQ